MAALLLWTYIVPMVLQVSYSAAKRFSRALAWSAFALLVCVRNGTGFAEEPTTPNPASIAAVDAALPKMALLLPRQIDADSDLIKVRRENSEIIYTIQFRPQAQAKADQMRKAAASNPQVAMSTIRSLIKKFACEPEPNQFIKDGFTIAWELVDAKGSISRSSVTLADCN